MGSICFGPYPKDLRENKKNVLKGVWFLEVCPSIQAVWILPQKERQQSCRKDGIPFPPKSPMFNRRGNSEGRGKCVSARQCFRAWFNGMGSSIAARLEVWTRISLLPRSLTPSCFSPPDFHWHSKVGPCSPEAAQKYWPKSQSQSTFLPCWYFRGLLQRRRQESDNADRFNVAQNNSPIRRKSPQGNGASRGFAATYRGFLAAVGILRVGGHLPPRTWGKPPAATAVQFRYHWRKSALFCASKSGLGKRSGRDVHWSSSPPWHDLHIPYPRCHPILASPWGRYALHCHTDPQQDWAASLV